MNTIPHRCSTCKHSEVPLKIGYICYECIHAKQGLPKWEIDDKYKYLADKHPQEVVGKR